MQSICTKRSTSALQYLSRRALPIARSPLLTIKPRNHFTPAFFLSMSSVAVDSDNNKRRKLDMPLIGTHNGHFHADEALAVYLLRLLPDFQSSELVRTRDAAVLEPCTVVVDVGGEYDPPSNRYDHHQRTFTTTFPGRDTKLSSAGLVYMHFGKQIIAQTTGLPADSEDVAVLYEKLYDDLIEAFDANDNGVSVYDTKALAQQGLQKRFEDRGFSIASVVNRFNHATFAAPGQPSLQPAQADSKEEAQRKEDERFLRASAFVGQQFLMELSDKASSWLPARSIVRAAYAERRVTHPSGRILVLPHRDGGLPWSDHLYDAERAETASTGGAAEDAQVLYVLFPESGASDTKWRIRAVSVEGGGFDNRKDLPDAWKGVRDQELSEVSGVPGCVFVHASGFIGGNATFEGALEMAVKAVGMPKAGLEM